MITTTVSACALAHEAFTTLENDQPAQARIAAAVLATPAGSREDVMAVLSMIDLVACWLREHLDGELEMPMTSDQFVNWLETISQATRLAVPGLR